MLTEPAYLRIVRASAAYDLVVTIGFATPWSFLAIIAAIGAVHDALGLPGSVPQPDLWHVLFANLLGSVVVVWSLVRLRLRLAVLGRYDLVARLLFASWQVHALTMGASWTVLAFLAFEIAFAALQALPYRNGQGLLSPILEH
ncbi:MAG: hypothetical protein F9K19_00375 [Rhizobiaceae bacterium]|nr:MAG: hypothetical protein F9K19_00375 [Rhizobiaceae bacterium]CAG1014471.1 hypothetical protein RHIZO_04789 [Rhizobiaceae bacterium]